MDFNSRCKKLGYSYTAPIVTSSAPTLMEMKREVADDIFRSRRDQVKVHDCRDEKLVDFRDKHLWEAWLLSHGVRQTSESVNALYRPDENQLLNQVEKHMYTIGKRGSSKGDFEYPQGLTVDDEGNIFVADTKNHRIQVFTQCGIIRRAFGEKGSEEGQFDCPTGVAVMPNEDIVVAEQKNKRVQVFSSNFKFKSKFTTLDEPIALVADEHFTLVLATCRATIEVYRHLGKLQHNFSLLVSNGSQKSASSCLVFIAVNKKEEVLVSDPVSCSVTFYKYDGTPLYRFEPLSAAEGLTFVPVGVAVDVLGRIVLADSLNHVVNVYSERGTLLRHHAGPTDNMGAVRALALGMDGHLVVTECISNGPHCVKIFRYLDCDWSESSAGHTPIRAEVVD